MFREIMTLILIISIGLIACSEKSPSIITQEKSAPPFPQKYDGDPEKCLKVPDEIIKNKFNPNGETEYLSEQADLNLDGTCEVVGYYSKECGTGSCGNSIYQLIDSELKFISNFGGYLGTYYEPINGWLQIKTGSRGGWCCSAESIESYVDGAYQTTRIDRYETDDDEKPQEYVETIYPVNGYKP